MNTDNKTVREKALEWWGNKNYKSRKILADTYTDNSGNVDAALAMDEETIERIFVSENPQITSLQERLWDGLTGTPIEKEQSKGVIEGLEDATRSYCFNNPDANNNIGENSFKGGAQWHHDTHYTPLLELCGELNDALRASLNYIYRNTHSDNLILSDAEQEVENLILKANQLLNK